MRILQHWAVAAMLVVSAVGQQVQRVSAAIRQSFPVDTPDQKTTAFEELKRIISSHPSRIPTLEPEVGLTDQDVERFKYTYNSLKNAGFNLDQVFEEEFSRGNKKYKTSNSLLSLGFKNQVSWSVEGETYSYWDERRATLLDFLLRDGADINKLLEVRYPVDASYHKTTIFNYCAAFGLEQTLKEAIKRGARPQTLRQLDFVIGVYKNDGGFWSGYRGYDSLESNDSRRRKIMDILRNTRSLMQDELSDRRQSLNPPSPK
jgi:hypothetical protein